MRARHLLWVLALLLPLGPSRASAQTLLLCEADWIDAERVLALITVEVEDPARFVFRVAECTETSAQVSLSGPEELERHREVRLGATAPEARSRLVALVLVEMVRLGRRPRAVVPPGASEAGAASGADSDSDTRSESGSDSDADSDSDSDADSDTHSESGSDSDADSGSGSGSATDSATATATDTDSGAGSEPDTGSDAGPDGLPGSAGSPTCDRGTLLSGRRCTAAFGVGVGVARHQIGQAGRASAWPIQLRLRGRWRALVMGARVAGVFHAASFDGTEVTVGSYTGFAGLELFGRRARRAHLAVSVIGELGAIRYRSRAQGCAPGGCFGSVSGARATYGALAALRLELPIRRGAFAVELEAGWTRGLIVAAAGEPVAGLGGAQLALSLEATFGRSS